MKVTLLITSFNSLSQAVYVWLKDDGCKVDVVFAGSVTLKEEIEDFKPELILCPFLKHYVSKDIYEKYPTFVFHPGIRGDRGAYSIEWALLKEKKEWGGVWLKVEEELDGGDIYAFDNFSLRDVSKASVYRHDELKVALKTLPVLLQNIKNEVKIPQIKSPILNKPKISIDWEKDSTKTIVKKINILDSFPGVSDEILGVKVHLFGAWEEEKLKADKPKNILAKRDGAVCLSTIDGAVWISHLKEPHRFKLPSTYVLKNRLKGVKEYRLPLIFDRSYKTFYEITAETEDEVGYLYFNFHNGAMMSEQCIKLKYAYDYLKESCKVIVLMGGEEFFSNGIHLNILEDSEKQGEDGWSNINAMNNLIKSIIFSEDVLTVAYFGKNAGAGGVFLGLGCDRVLAKDDTVLNPHYKTLSLSGSEYHTYSLTKRVGEQTANKLLEECLPVSSKKAKELGMVDEILKSDDELKSYIKTLLDSMDIDEFLWEKQDFLEENKEFIESKKEAELKVMYPEFWDEESLFHEKRREFVYKTCPTYTPRRLKYNA